MKRIFAIFAIIATLILCGGCVSAQSKTVSVFGADSASTIFTAQSMETELDAFFGSGEQNRRDRTSFSEKEKQAADYLFSRMESAGYVSGESLFTQDFTVSVSGRTESTTVLSSQNVIAVYNPSAEKKVVIGANYDNTYSAIAEIGFAATSGEGVENNATGVSVLIALAEAFISNAPNLDYSLYFVFFGASEPGVVGSVRFVTEYLKSVSDVLLMVNLDSVSSEKIELYSDEVDTVEGEYFIERGKELSTEFVKMPRAQPIYAQIFADNLDYSHRGLIGDHAAFFEKGVPVVGFLGGEEASLAYPAPTIDTLESFKQSRVGYGTAMADTATLVYNALTASEFFSLAATFTTDKFDYGFFKGGYIANIVYLALVVLAAVGLLIAVKTLEKKYPFIPPQIPRVKIAVFGMDYEQKTDNDIYIEVVERNPDPFKSGNDIDPFA